MDEFLRAALEEAKAGLEEGGMPVGSVVVAQGRVIGRGRNRYQQTGDPTTHAEIEAIRDAAARAGGADPARVLRGATCYTTMTPCEMCAGAIILLGLARVVIAETQTHAPAATKPLLERQGIAVEIPQDAECVAFAEAWFEANPAERKKRKKRRQLNL